MPRGGRNLRVHDRGFSRSPGRAAMALPRRQHAARMPRGKAAPGAVVRGARRDVRLRGVSLEGRRDDGVLRQRLARPWRWVSLNPSRLTACLALGVAACGWTFESWDAPARQTREVNDASVLVLQEDVERPADDECQAVAQGESCPYIGARCVFGTNVDDQCNDRAVCDVERRWKVQRGDAACASVCPESAFALGPGAECNAPGALCARDGRVCGCGGLGRAVDAGPRSDAASDASQPATDAGPSRLLWQCLNQDRSWCPGRPPSPGTSCMLGVVCDYGTCLFDRPLAFECRDGFWRPYAGSCR